MSNYSISVVIPVKNGADTLERCLQSLHNQTLQPDEIIIIDSGSEDDSIAIAERNGATILKIAPDSFDHGLTRNLGVQHAMGNLVFLTVQDAWLPGDDTLERMANHFKDTEVMAVTGHQAVPHEKDKNPLWWYRRFSDYKVDIRQVNDIEAFKKAPQLKQRKLIAWDNVVAMYRRQALTELPFEKTEMSEDWVWSYRALLKGWKLLRDSSLVAYHYHHHTYNYTFSTNYSINYHSYKFFKFLPDVPGMWVHVLKDARHILKNKELTIEEKWYWIRHNYHIRLAKSESNKEFLKRQQSGGEQALEEGYKKYCVRIPQGRQMASTSER